MIQEKTTKEICTNKNCSNDNYSYSLVYTVWVCWKATIQEKAIKENALKKTIKTIITATTASLFYNFVVYPVWVCWKAMIQEKAIKEKCTDKN